MRILGPDGQPIGGGPPASDEVKEMVERAKALAAQGDAASALQQMVFAFQNDVSSDLVLDTTCDLLRNVMQAQGAQESEELQLFEQLRENRDAPEILYQIGDRFAHLGQTFVARPFLVKAKELLGKTKNELSQAVDIDLAQVWMDLGAYQETINMLHYINDTYGGLHIGLILMMAECYALLRQTEEATAVLQALPEEAVAQYPGGESWLEEVGDMIARVGDFEDEEMELRAWHYVQTRGMLLETNPDENLPGGRFILFQPSEEDVAYIVGLTAALLDHKGYAPNRLLWLGDSSEPLARLFAQWWEIDEENVRPYQHGDNTDDEDDLTLLVMAHSHDVFHLNSEEEFVDLAQARAGLITFALDVRWTERQPMTPDIAGFLAQACNLPWESRFEVSEDQQTVTPIEETRDAPTIAADIAAQFPDEGECDQFAQETLEDYNICTDLLLDHRDGSLMRRPMVTHSPIPSPRIGF